MPEQIEIPLVVTQRGGEIAEKLEKDLDKVRLSAEQLREVFNAPASQRAAMLEKLEEGAKQAARGIQDLTEKSSRLSDAMQHTSGHGLNLSNILSGVVGGGTVAIFEKLVEVVHKVAEAMIQTVERAAEFGRDLAKLQVITGLSTDRLQVMGLAAKEAGVNIETTASVGVPMLERKLAEGSQFFERWGLDAQTLMAMPVDAALNQVMETISRLPTQSERVAASMELFGRSGARAILPLIEAMGGAESRARTLGVVVGEEDVAALEGFHKQTVDLGAALEAMETKLAAAIVSTKGFDEALEAIVDLVVDVGTAIKEHGPELKFLADQLIRMATLNLGQTVRDFREIVRMVNEMPDWAKAMIAGGTLGMLGRAPAAPGESPTPTTRGVPGEVPPKPGPTPEEIAIYKAALEETRKALAQEMQEREKFYAADMAAFNRWEEEQIKERERFYAADMAAFNRWEEEISAEEQKEMEERARVWREHVARMKSWHSELDRMAREAHRERMRELEALSKAFRLISEGATAFANVLSAMGVKGAEGFARIVGTVMQLGQELVRIKKMVESGEISAGLGKIFSALAGAQAAARAGPLGGALSGGLTAIALGATGPIGIGLGALAGGLLGIFGGRGAREEERRRAEEERKKRDAEELKRAQEERARVVSEGVSGAVGGVTAMVTGLPIATPQDAFAQAEIFSATFWAVVKEKGIVEAATVMKPAFDAMQASLATAGVDPAIIAKVMDPIAAIMKLTGDEATRGVVSGIQGVDNALKGLAQSGYLTTAAFGGVMQQAQSAFDRLVAGGVDSNTALLAIAPLLGDIQRAASQYGLTLDANTQKLVDQAKQAGISFPTDPMERVIDRLDRIIVALGGTLPTAATTAGTSIQTAMSQTGNAVTTTMQTTMDVTKAAFGEMAVFGVDRAEYVGSEWAGNLGKIALYATDAVVPVTEAFVKIEDASLEPLKVVSGAIDDINSGLKDIVTNSAAAGTGLSNIPPPGGPGAGTTGLQHGALVPGSFGGSVYRLGEANTPEVVTPVSALYGGLARMMSQMIASQLGAAQGSGGGQTVVVNVQIPMAPLITFIEKAQRASLLRTYAPSVTNFG